MMRTPNEFVAKNRESIHKMIDVLLDAGYDQVLLRKEGSLTSIEWINTSLGYKFVCLSDEEYVEKY